MAPPDTGVIRDTADPQRDTGRCVYGYWTGRAGPPGDVWDALLGRFRGRQAG